MFKPVLPLLFLALWPAAAQVSASGPEPATPPSEHAARPPVESGDKDHGVASDYRIGGGDVLQISVWKEPDASVQSAVVRTDGKISLPLIKEMTVTGLTPSEVEKAITIRLSKFVKDPDVTVVVAGINSQKIYATGGVRKEGPLPFTYKMTIMQAISEAGGLTDFAKKKKIYVLRTQNGKTEMLPFDYDAVLKGKKMESNILLQPGDTIVVPH